MSFSSSSSPEIPAACRADSPQHEFEYKTQEDVLEDLSSRFILNLPEEELASLERISFQIEQAHWFYEDFIREQNPRFPSLPLKKFSAMLFEQCPMLNHFKADHDQAFHNFMLYKTRVPVCGAIMLNETWEKCLLVKGWKSSSGWGFPKGKINEDEPTSSCAVREVLEETGYNLAGQINSADVIEMVIKEQKIVLYIVPGVPEDFAFKTKTRKEISKIEWFRLTDLPTWKRQKGSAGKFYLITPFIGALKAWINEKKPPSHSRKPPRSKRNNAYERGSPRQHSITDSPYNSSQDAHQESSSQSSSADNGEPQTPSPQYPHAIANHVNVNTADAEVLDPHFAKLLSSLALSGQAAAAKKNEKATLSVLPEEPPERNTPVPITSSNVPEAPVETAKEVNSRNHSMGSRARHVVSSSQSKTIASQLSSSSLATMSDAASHTRRDSISTASTSSPVVPMASPRTSRRTSSIADISPYLSKPPEIPSSAKRWKELALLESVADESARMTTVLRNTSTPAPTLPVPNGLPPLPPHPAYGPASIPPPSASVPPHQFQARYDTNILYSSGPVMQPGTGFTGISPSVLPQFVPLDDPFKVRPRTSQAINRPLYPPSGSMSMNQSQLSALMSLTQTTPGVPSLPNVQHPLAASPLNSSFRFPPNPSAVPPPPIIPTQRQGPFPPLPMNHQPISVIPPGTSYTPGPLSAPAISPRFDMASPMMSNNNPLLSILNGNIQGPSGAPIAMDQRR